MPEAPDGASDALEEAARFFDVRLNEQPDNPYFLYGRGAVAKLSGDYKGAVRNLEAGIRADACFWDIFEEVIPYYRTKQELLRAVVLLEEEIARNPENSFLHQGLSFIHFWLDDYGTSERSLRQALKLQEAAGDGRAQAACLYDLANLNMYLNLYGRARQDIKRSIRLAAECGDVPYELRGLELLGFLMIDQGDIRNALEMMRSVYDRARELRDPEIEMLCSRTLGVAYLETGDLGAAEDCLSRAASWYKRTGEDRRLGVVQYWQSLLYKQLGDFSRALDIARQGLAISQKEGFRTAEAFHLSEIGDLYHSLGHYNKALSYNKKALLISQNYIGKWSRVACLNSIGAVYMETARYREALEYFKLALNYVRQIAHNREEACCLYNIGLAYIKLGDEDRAFEYFTRSRREAEQSGKKAALGLADIRLGDLALSRNDLKAAERMYQSALEIGSETGQPAVCWQAYAGHGDLAAHRDRILKAADYYRRAVAVIEDQRNHIMEREHSAGFFQSKLGIYENLVNLYYELHAGNPDEGYDWECFNFAEKAKSRAFLDDLRAARIDPHTFSGTPESSRKIHALSQEVSRILTELSGTGLDRARCEELWESLEQTEEDLQVAVEAVGRIRPDLAMQLRSEPSGIRAIRERVLEPGTALIEFLVGEQHLFIFYLTRGRLAFHRLDKAETQTILEVARNYSHLLSSPRMTSADCAAAGRRLYECLILPGRGVITEGIRNLIIVPDRELCFLPFEMLTAGSEPPSDGTSPDFLFHHFAVTYAPSASSLVNIMKRPHIHPGSKDLLAVGDPYYHERGDSGGREKWDNPIQEYYRDKRFQVEPLPFTRREIRCVKSFVSGDRRDILLGKAASEEAIKGLRLKDYRILHFATHSLVDDQVGSRSALVLAQDDDPGEDGFLQVREIYSIKLDADLVVLSACSTALGKLEKGEGIQGLPRAFFCAGARSVLVSLWSVSDRSTSRFMELFYKHLSRGESKQEALRRAKLDMMDAKDTRPRQWAGFILMGEGGGGIPLSKPTFWQQIKFRIF
jgi:CHAT domain-containing protein/Tfp pilus assembly protein PilF